MTHKYLQPFQYPPLNAPLSGKTGTLDALVNYLNENKGEYKNGEEITLRYKNENGGVLSSIVTILKEGETFTVSASIVDDETLKLVESDTEPEDKSKLWVTDSEEVLSPEEFQKDLDGLKLIVQNLCDFINNSELTTGVIDGGRVSNTVSSQRQNIMSIAEPMVPPVLDDEEENPVINSHNPKDEAEEIKPEPNNQHVKHIQATYAETVAELKANILNYLDRELIICYEDLCLYTKINGNITKLSGGGGVGPTPGPTPSEDTMEGIYQNLAKTAISSIKFEAPSGKMYYVGVDVNGQFYVQDSNYYEKVNMKFDPGTSYTPDENNHVNKILTQDSGTNGCLFINSFFCGGVDGEDTTNPVINEHSYNYCSHNFVELSNMTKKDINLNGITLNYCESGNNWVSLPLKGIIKKYSTFLIRGAQCSLMEANTTKIKVNTYDMEWYTDTERTKLIQFSQRNSAFYLRYVPDADKEAYLPTQPWVGSKLYTYGYIDLVGTANTSFPNPADPTAFDTGINKQLGPERLMHRYYDMDNVKQANKAATARTNATEIVYVDLSRDDLYSNVEAFTPKASFENKSIFFDKTDYLDMKPSLITCSFGIQATDGGESKRATRCFNWVSKGYYDEYLWIYKDGSLVFSGASINGEKLYKPDGVTLNSRYYYNRIRQEATNGKIFTVHKQIVKGLEAGTYTYTAGKADKDGNPIAEQCTDIHSFTVRTDAEIDENGMTFIQTSDQQGFNWIEYEMWRYAASYAEKFANGTKTKDTSGNFITTGGEGIMPHFMINTGDMTQNGNRPNEWLDYFNAKGFFNDMEEMSTVGNNDLCSEIPYEYGTGEDITKINPRNIEFYYTFELDESNMPVFTFTLNGYEYVDKSGNLVFDVIPPTEGDYREATRKYENLYIPSLYSYNYGKHHFMCLNSELTISTESVMFGLPARTDGVPDFIYERIQEWCATDIEKNGAKEEGWNIAYCHEMPFTIMTDALMFGKDGYLDIVNNELVENPKKKRGGSHLNEVAKKTEDDYREYWFSEFCQKNNIRLVIGGHKHTQSTSRRIKENVSYSEGLRKVTSMKPVIQLTYRELKNDYNNATGLVKYKFEENGAYYYYPNSWFNWTYVQDVKIDDIIYEELSEVPTNNIDFNSAKYIHTTSDDKYYYLMTNGLNESGLYHAHYCTFELVGKEYYSEIEYDETKGSYAIYREMPAATMESEGLIKVIETGSDAKYYELITGKTLRNSLTGEEVKIAPIYAMSQSSAYKHTSNKELPSHFNLGEGELGFNIPWLKYYYPASSWDGSSAKSDGGQKFPFYTIWKVEKDEINGYVKKVAGLFDSSGKFDINANYDNMRNGVSNAKGGTDPCKGIVGAVNGIGYTANKTFKAMELVGVTTDEHITIKREIID